MDIDEVLDLLLLVLLLSEAEECLSVMTNQSRRFWVRPLYKDRDEHGFFNLNFEKMYSNDPEQFRLAVRMNKDVFDVLFNLVKEDLTKHSNRPVISSKCRLFMTLVYLAHGGSKQLFSMAFKMGLTSVKRIVNETCDVLWNSLGHIYLSVPSQSEWSCISRDFHTMWNLPNCLGAIDGKHINITCPPNSGSLFYNYKGTYSIVLLGICDANYTFTGIDLGAYGSQSDGGVLWHSDFGQKLFSGNLEVPEDDILPNSNVKFPHYFVGDAAFPLKTFLMRPYPGDHLPFDRENFNKRLSRARRVIENAFGILVSRWRILLSPLQMSPNSAEKIVKAAVLLHNFVKMHDGSYIPKEYVDSYQGENVINGLWRKEASPLQRPKRIFSNNASKDAFKLRDQLKDYLLNDLSQ